MSKSSRSTQAGCILVLVAGISWGFISLFVRGLSGSGISAMNIMCLRCILTGAVLCIALLCARPAAFRVKARDLWCFAGCGIGSIVLFNTCFFYAIQNMTVNLAVVLLYTSPIFVTLLSRLIFKEAFTARKILAAVLVTGGCALVSFAQPGDSECQTSLAALFIGLMAGFTYALYSIFARFAQNRGYDSISITLWTFIFAGATGLCLMDWHDTLDALARHDGTVASLAGLVFISTLLPFAAYTIGLRRLKLTLAAVLAASEPVVGTIVGVCAFNEPITMQAVAGMLLVILAFFL